MQARAVTDLGDHPLCLDDRIVAGAGVHTCTALRDGPARRPCEEPSPFRAVLVLGDSLPDNAPMDDLAPVPEDGRTVLTFKRGIARLQGAVDRLAPAGITDLEQIRRARLVVRVTLFMLVASVAMATKYVVESGGGLLWMSYLMLSLLGLSLGVHKLLGATAVAGHILCFTAWLVFFLIARDTGGIESPNIVSNAIVVVMAMMVTGRAGGLFWMVVVIGSVLTQRYLTEHGMVSYSVPPGGLHAMQMSEAIATCVATGLIALSYEQGKSSVLSELGKEQQRVERANRDLQLILDSAGQGFLSLTPDGRVVGERSAAVDRWFDEVVAEQTIWSLISQLDPSAGEWLDVGWAQLGEGLLPLASCIDQLPKTIRAAGLTLAAEYKPVLSREGELDKVVLILSDTSAELAQQAQRDLLEALERALSDPEGFRVFLLATRKDVDELLDAGLPEAELWMRLHTLKGNSAVMGLTALARTCHQAEDALAVDRVLSEEVRASLDRELSIVEERVAAFINHEAREIVITTPEYASFLEDLDARRPHRVLATTARCWSFERVFSHLSRVRHHLRRLAERQGKPLEVEIEDDHVRVPQRFSEFWKVLVHVARNAVDHGVESAEERLALDKAAARVTLRAQPRGTTTLVEVHDNGRGIDWARIREAAEKRGLPASSREELHEALFTCGSTVEEVSETSGRGVGMASVRSVCDVLDIQVEVESAENEGTRFSFILPFAARTPS